MDCNFAGISVDTCGPRPVDDVAVSPSGGWGDTFGATPHEVALPPSNDAAHAPNGFLACA